jgi:shikimate kinase
MTRSWQADDFTRLLYRNALLAGSGICYIRGVKNLVLVGFMGSGKTEAGKLAAARLGMKFVDMDEIIEQRHNQTISRIFETKGEAHFRQQERALVRELAAEEGRVIATGGGIVLNPNNLRDFGRTGVVICCWVDAGVAYERTKNAKHRPLLEKEGDRRAHIEALLREREPLYKAIPLRIDTSAMSVEQQANELIRIYKQQTGQ